MTQGRSSHQAQKQVNMTHQVIPQDEIGEPSTLDLVQIEDMLKASQQSNIFSNALHTAESHDAGRSIVHENESSGDTRASIII